ncbi:MAG: hypothetical protein HXY24_11550 [Rubrivivax sp.]|nr:hypothetical protein [Rubrivivax sp.]
MLDHAPPSGIDPDYIQTSFERLRRQAVDNQTATGPPVSCAADQWVHHLPLADDFSDFLRLALGYRRISEDHARTIENRVAQIAQEYP